MPNMKPALFNTDMVRAILDNLKTATRRVIKPQPPEKFIKAQDVSGEWFFNDKLGDNDMMTWWPSYEKGIAPPYIPSDILYVRETWCWCHCWDCGMDIEEGCADETAEKFYNVREAEWGCYGYKASFAENESAFDRWRPSIHMPREAARIFLRVTAVRAERLQDSFFAQDSTIFSLQDEGIDIGDHCRKCIENYGYPCCSDLNPELEIDEDTGEDEYGGSECGMLGEVRGDFTDLWNRLYAKPRPVKDGNGLIDHYESYPWEDICETRTYRGKPWYVIGNPWVWGIEFARISKEEAERT